MVGPKEYRRRETGKKKTWIRRRQQQWRRRRRRRRIRGGIVQKKKEMAPPFKDHKSRNLLLLLLPSFFFLSLPLIYTRIPLTYLLYVNRLIKSIERLSQLRWAMWIANFKSKLENKKKKAHQLERFLKILAKNKTSSIKTAEEKAVLDRIHTVSTVKANRFDEIFDRLGSHLWPQGGKKIEKIEYTRVESCLIKLGIEESMLFSYRASKAIKP